MRYFVDGRRRERRFERHRGPRRGGRPRRLRLQPVDGRVIAVTVYQLLGRYTDDEIELQLDDDPSLLLIITHIAKPQVTIGADVTAGESVLGTVRGFPRELDQDLRRFTTDAGDHVQLVAVRVPTQVSGF